MTKLILPGPVPRRSLAMIHDDVEYYQHQARGVRRMSQMTGALLADEMGLGKTLQAATVAAIAYEKGEGTKFLIVCPITLKENWADELDSWTNFRYQILSNGPKSSKAKRQAEIAAFAADPNLNFLFVNYEQVVAHLNDLNAVKFCMAIYDEGHAIKSRKSKRTKAVHKLRIKRNFVLTGSPLLNQVDDLWAILHRIDPIEWPSYWTFTGRYALYGGYMDKQIVGIKNEAELRERLARYMLRRTKAECLDLPDKIIIPEFVVLHPEQRAAYDQLKAELKIEFDPGMTPFEVQTNMEKVLRFKQICGTLAALPGQPDISAKLDRAMEIIDELAQNTKGAVVFTQFRDVLAAQNRRIEAMGIPVFTLHGDVLASERRGVVRQWEQVIAAGDPAVLTVMYQVGGQGLTMTAASHGIALDKLYAPLLNDQAFDRLHRIGQKDTVFIHDMIAKDTYDDDGLAKILKQKVDVNHRVIDQDSSEWKLELLKRITAEEEEE